MYLLTIVIFATFVVGSSRVYLGVHYPSDGVRAESGPEAVELLARRSYDVILTNLHMPGMSGEELYRRIEQDWPHLTSRVVFVTAARPDTQFRARFGGRPVPILTKPYSADRLRQVIEEVVARDV